MTIFIRSENDKNIVIKGADKGSTVVVWDRDDYIKEAERQLGESDVYEEAPHDPESLISTIHRTIEEIRKRGDLKKETIKYFEVKDTKFARFYLLSKIHKQLHNEPGRPVISNCGYYTEESVPKQTLKQKPFHEHYCSDRHNGIQD